MTPKEIEITLHYYWSPDQYTEMCQADVDAHQYLLKSGMLVKDGDGRYEATAKLQFYVNHLCSIKLPVTTTTWSIPE